MTATTATWAIPYATGTDPLCNGATITESMAERVDAVLEAFALDLVFLGNIPAAAVQVSNTSNISVPTVGGLTAGVPWDTVNYDTASMVNLPVDPTVITYQRTGYYIYGGGIDFAEAPFTAGQKYTMNVFSTSAATAPNGQMERDNGVAMIKTTAALNRWQGVVINGGDGEIDMELGRSPTTNGSPATVAPPSYMYARWYGDL